MAKHHTSVVPSPSSVVPVVTVAPVVAADVVIVTARPLPIGFDALRAAVIASGINVHTDASVDAIRADVAAVVAAMPSDVAMPPRGRGRFTGFRTYDFQNTLFYANDRDGWNFTDRTLAVVWAVELASNACDFTTHARYVGSTRTDYRNGRHGSNVTEPGNHASTAYIATASAAPVAEPTA